MESVIVAVLVLAGSLFTLVAALGVLRLPDLPMRMHAATKAGALGAGILLLAVAVAAADAGVAVRALAALAFLALTAPVASHAIGRAAYRAGDMPLWEGTVADELREAAPRAAATPRRAPASVPVPGIAPRG